MKEKYSINEDGTCTCSECGKKYSIKGIGTHYWRAHGDGMGWSENNKNRVAWNRGLSKETDVRVRKNAEQTSKTFKKQVEDGTYVPRIIGEEARKERSKRMSKKNPGGKAKWYTVNGVKVQGSWEKKVAEMLINENIRWERPSPMSYSVEGNIKHYTPDFYINEYDCFLEVKGYWWGNDREKMRLVESQHPDMAIIYIEKPLFNKLKNGKVTMVTVLENFN